MERLRWQRYNTGAGMKVNGIGGAKTGTVQTTNGTATVLCEFDLDAPGFCPALDGIGFHIEGAGVAKTAGNAVGGARVSQCAKRIAGTLSLEGSLNPIASGVAGLLLGNIALATATLTLAVSGVKIQLIATGVLLTTINWTGYLYIWSSDV